MKFGVHIVKESQTATEETVVAATDCVITERNPKHDICSDSLQRLHCWYPCDVLYKHTQTHILAVTWDRLRHIMQLPVLREVYFKLYSCIRMERFLRTVITNVFLPPEVTFSYFFPCPITFFYVKNGYYILTRGEQICVIKLSGFFSVIQRV